MHGSVRRAPAALIWIICLVQRRRFFRGAVFPGFIHVCAPTACADGRGSDEYVPRFCSEMWESFHDALL